MLLDVSPPMTLERLPVAVIHSGVQTSVDLAPGVTPEEAGAARLIAAAITIPLRN